MSLNDIAKEISDLCSFHTIRNRLLRVQVVLRERGGYHPGRKIFLTTEDLSRTGKEIAVKYNISLSYAYALLRARSKEKGLDD